jgi:phenylpropionate dioxygenase-like ring-hydroxylating dioxygenase large terminal subunit
MPDSLNSEAAAAAPQSVDAEMLLGFWYPALRSEQLRGRNLEQAMLLGVPLVLGRDSGSRPFALRDTCPHRGIPLSYGRLDAEGLLECCYHGWRFEPVSGQCQEIPSLTADSKLKVERIFANAFPCREQDGYFWVFLPEQKQSGSGAGETSTPEAGPPQLPVFSDRHRRIHLWAEMPTTVDHGIIGLMDPAHGPFVHQSWWWRSRHSIHEKQKAFEPIPNGFRMSPHTPSSNSAPYKLLRLYAQAEAITTTIDFVLPNRRLEQIRAGKYWFSSQTTVTPLTRDRCRIDFCAAWNLFPWLPITPVLRSFGNRFIRQDQRTMEMQAEGLRHNPNLMLIDDADRPAKWYFELKKAWLESRRTGQPMRHPMSGPVTLRWRS